MGLPLSLCQHVADNVTLFVFISNVSGNEGRRRDQLFFISKVHDDFFFGGGINEFVASGCCSSSLALKFSPICLCRGSTSPASYARVQQLF